VISKTSEAEAAGIAAGQVILILTETGTEFALTVVVA
jgi:hypothetical protein